MEEDFRTVLTFHQSHDAHLAKTKLKSEEIEALIHDDNVMNSLYPTNTFGGIKLIVLEKDFDKASEVLVKAGYLQEGKKRNKEGLLCPRCQSDSNKVQKPPIYLKLLYYALLKAPLAIFKKIYICYDCNHRWKRW